MTNGFEMKLLSALARYNLVQSRIDDLIQSKDPSASNLTFLCRQSDALRDEILHTKPESRDEAAKQLGCILNLMRREATLQGIEGDLIDMIDIASQTNGENLIEAAPRTAQPAPQKPSAETYFGGTIADYVAFSEGRVSLIDTNYIYIATSEENARFYGRRQVGIMGQHIVDLIGETRFHTRAKPRLDECFAGNQQSYHHALNCNGEARVMRCDMKPVNSSQGTILGALVYITDVTEQVRKLRPSSETMVLQFHRSS